MTFRGGRVGSVRWRHISAGAARAKSRTSRGRKPYLCGESIRSHSSIGHSLPDKFHCAEVFRADLADARARWLAEAEKLGDGGEELLRRQRSDFLARVDHEGRKVNFYSLRHTHGTALGDARVPQKDIPASLHHTRSTTRPTATSTAA